MGREGEGKENEMRGGEGIRGELKKNPTLTSILADNTSKGLPLHLVEVNT